MSEPLCLLQVHAHPDDEASKGAGTTAKYAAEGVRNILVTCTGGEAGDILNPAADTPDVRADLPAVRIKELNDSVAILGYASLHLLGYRDSGMPDTDDNRRPDNFWNADIDEAVGKLVKIVREERPQVIIAYGDDHSFYPHPDHIRAHEIAVTAFEAAGVAERFPDAGAPWVPKKLYYSGWTRRRIQALADAFAGLDVENPFEAFLKEMSGDGDHLFTTEINVGDFLDKRRASLLAHRTQIDPESFWMAIPDQTLREVWPVEEYILARTLVDNGLKRGEIETDLFAGLR
ncbi:MAG TPA: mycothiol conjugate amidase Mca [Actinomycetota bacterium]|nr:mycothiol conjugate amidase Mca [Actinomycetota bacterium]